MFRNHDTGRGLDEIINGTLVGDLVSKLETYLVSNKNDYYRMNNLYIYQAKKGNCIMKLL